MKFKQLFLITALGSVVVLCMPKAQAQFLNWKGIQSGGTNTNSAQFQSLDRSQRDSIVLVERNLSGPRMGVSYAVSGESLLRSLRKRKMGPLLSQFGWHFEYQVIPEGGGPQFVVQFVPLAGGVEYGTLIPSGTIAMGVRFPEGFEFGLGPNIYVSDEGAETALMLGVGKSFNYGGVSIPVNLVLTTNPSGNRISIIFGYAISKTSR